MKKYGNWSIKSGELKIYQKDSWFDDFFKETEDGRYGVLFYNVDEPRMLAYAGFIAIYSLNIEAKLLFNTVKKSFYLRHNAPFYYAPLSDCLIFTSISLELFYPLIIFIKPSENKFTFIKKELIVSREQRKDEIIFSHIVNKDETVTDAEKLEPKKEIIKLNQLDWFNLKDFDDKLQKMW